MRWRMLGILSLIILASSMAAQHWGRGAQLLVGASAILVMMGVLALRRRAWRGRVAALRDAPSDERAKLWQALSEDQRASARLTLREPAVGIGPAKLIRGEVFLNRVPPPGQLYGIALISFCFGALPLGLLATGHVMRGQHFWAGLVGVCFEAGAVLLVVLYRRDVEQLELRPTGILERRRNGTTRQVGWANVLGLRPRRWRMALEIQTRDGQHVLAPYQMDGFSRFVELLVCYLQWHASGAPLKEDVGQLQ